MTAKKEKGPTPKQRHIRLSVIPEPEPDTRSVMVYTGEGTIGMRGQGNVTMDCGNCGVSLLKGMRVAQVRNLVFKCPNCGEYNETLV